MLIQLNKFHSDNNSLESVALRTPIFLATDKASVLVSDMFLFFIRYGKMMIAH